MPLVLAMNESSESELSTWTSRISPTSTPRGIENASEWARPSSITEAPETGWGAATPGISGYRGHW
jgi:hypothetical protein